MTDNIDEMHADLDEARAAIDWHLKQAKYHAAMSRRWKRLMLQYEDHLPGLIEAEEIAALAWGDE